jgi:hypothetical protein
MALSKTTQDHDTIRKWAEARGAMPAEVASTAKGKQTGILRFAFPKAKNRNDENLEDISWEEFFEKFDQNGLELIYQEKTAGGARSNFNKLIYPEDEHASSRSRGSSSRTSAASSRSTGSGSSSRSSNHTSISSGNRASGRSSTSGSKGGTQSGSRSSGSSSSGRTSATASHNGRSSGGAGTSRNRKAA